MILTRDEVAAKVAELKASGKTVGFTSGAFDLVHIAHVKLLENAKNECDVLVVGINSDASVKAYKGEDRPFIPEHDRATVVDSMSSVDFVFIFDERRNNVNIETIKPNLYIKAGDYTKEQLTSAAIIESLGGEVRIIPNYEGAYTTTDVCKKIIAAYGPSESDSLYSTQPVVSKSGPVVFIDRDGTINENTEYLHEPEKFAWKKNVLEGMKKLYDIDLRLAIVTDQPGIGLGYYTVEDFYRVNQELFKGFKEYKINISKIYFCPCGFDQKCDCRKPKPGLLLRAKKDMKIADLSQCFMIGDSDKDIGAGQAVGCKTIWIPDGDKKIKLTPDYVAKDMLDAAEWIIAQQRKH